MIDKGWAGKGHQVYGDWTGTPAMPESRADARQIDKAGDRPVIYILRGGIAVALTRDKRAGFVRETS